MKLTLMVQLAPGARVVHNLLVWMKGATVAIRVKVRLDVPLFVTVTVLTGLTVPLTCCPNVRLFEERATAGAVCATRLVDKNRKSRMQ